MRRSQLLETVRLKLDPRLTQLRGFTSSWIVGGQDGDTQAHTQQQLLVASTASVPAPAQAQRPQLRRWLDAFGEVYSRGVLAATAGAFAWLLASGVPLLGDGVSRGAAYRALGLLTAASPCALVAVPLAYVSAIAAIAGRCARQWALQGLRGGALCCVGCKALSGLCRTKWLDKGKQCLRPAAAPGLGAMGSC